MTVVSQIVLVNVSFDFLLFGCFVNKVDEVVADEDVSRQLDVVHGGLQDFLVDGQHFGVLPVLVFYLQSVRSNNNNLHPILSFT